MVIVYKAECDDGRVYVGITGRGLKMRRWHHENKAGTYSTHFSRALGKYGKNAFSWTVIEECTDWNQACQREIFWIAHYGSTNVTKGFNLTPGGDRATHNARTKQLISDTVKSKMREPKVIAAIVDSNKRRAGERHSREHIAKLALAHGARPFEVIKKDTGEKIGEFLVVREVAKLLGVAREHIRYCLRGKNGYKSAGGYIFRWIDAA